MVGRTFVKHQIFYFSTFHVQYFTIKKLTFILSVILYNIRLKDIIFILIISILEIIDQIIGCEQTNQKYILTFN